MIFHGTRFALSFVLLSAVSQIVPGQPGQPQPPADPNALVLSLDKGHLIAAAFLQEGKTLATHGSDGKLRLWDLEKGTQRGEAKVGVATNSHIFQFFELPDGKRLLLVGAYHKGYLLSLEDAKILTEFPLPDHQYPISYALLDRGTTLARFDRRQVFTYFDAETGKEKAGPKPAVEPKGDLPNGTRLALAPDAKSYAFNSGTPELRDAATHEVRYKLKADPKTQHFFRNGYYRPLYSADSSLVAMHGPDATLRVVEVASGKELRTLRLEQDPQRPGMPRAIAPVAVAPNGQWLLVTTEGQFSVLLLFGVYSGVEVRRFPGKVQGPTSTDIVLSEKGNLLVFPGQAFNLVEVWDMAEGGIKRKAAK